MACHNAEFYIEDSIRSFFSQDIKEKELIIVDDASTDQSIVKAKKIVLSLGIVDKVKFINFDNNRGCAAARNAALNISKGKFLCIWDADDYHENDRVSRIIENMNNKNLAVCGSWARVVDKQGNMSKTYDYPPEYHDQIVWMLPGKLNPMIDPSCIIRKEALIRVGGWSEDPKISLVPDLDLWFRLVDHGFKMGNICVPLTYYRVQPYSNTVSKKDDMIKHHVEVVKRYHGRVELNRHATSVKS
jgi:glycosyltransferase involved in cell wall biosynthesis